MKILFKKRAKLKRWLFGPKLQKSGLGELHFLDFEEPNFELSALIFFHFFVLRHFFFIFLSSFHFFN